MLSEDSNHSLAFTAERSVNTHSKYLPADERRTVTVEAVVALAGETNPAEITTSAIAKQRRGRPDCESAPYSIPVRWQTYRAMCPGGKYPCTPLRALPNRARFPARETLTTNPRPDPRYFPEQELRGRLPPGFRPGPDGAHSLPWRTQTPTACVG